MEDQQELGLTESECRMLYNKLVAAHIIEKKEGTFLRKVKRQRNTFLRKVFRRSFLAGEVSPVFGELFSTSTHSHDQDGDCHDHATC